MKSFYKIISYILLPPAILYSMMVLILIAAALANPAMLLPLFMLVCVAIYTFMSFYFLMKGVDGGNKLTHTTKDWIKVNAIVTGLFAFLILGQAVYFISNPKMLQTVAEQAMLQQKDAVVFTKPQLEQYMTIVLYVFLAHGILLLSHIPVTLRLLKENAHLFEEGEAQ